MIPLLAQAGVTLTAAPTGNGFGLSPDLKLALIGALVAIIGALALWARAKIDAATKNATADGLEAEKRRLRAERELEEERRLSVALAKKADESERIKVKLIESVDAGIAALPDETRRKVTQTMKAAQGELQADIDAEVHATREEARRRTEERKVAEETKP